jgi:hypothetical protein
MVGGRYRIAAPHPAQAPCTLLPQDAQPRAATATPRRHGGGGPSRRIPRTPSATTGPPGTPTPRVPPTPSATTGPPPPRPTDASHAHTTSPTGAQRQHRPPTPGGTRHAPPQTRATPGRHHRPPPPRPAGGPAEGTPHIPPSDDSPPTPGRPTSPTPRTGAAGARLRLPHTTRPPDVEHACACLRPPTPGRRPCLPPCPRPCSGPPHQETPGHASPHTTRPRSVEYT